MMKMTIDYQTWLKNVKENAYKDYVTLYLEEDLYWGVVDAINLGHREVEVSGEEDVFGGRDICYYGGCTITYESYDFFPCAEDNSGIKKNHHFFYFEVAPDIMLLVDITYEVEKIITDAFQKHND